MSVQAKESPNHIPMQAEEEDFLGADNYKRRILELRRRQADAKIRVAQGQGEGAGEERKCSWPSSCHGISQAQLGSLRGLFRIGQPKTHSYEGSHFARQHQGCC